MGFKSFAPDADRVLVPVTSRNAALAGIAFYAPSGLRSARAQKIAWRATSLLGPRVLPGQTVQWAPPMGTEVWNELLANWRTVVGGLDGFAVFLRGGDEDLLRVLLLRDGEPVGHVKLKPCPGDSLAHEARVLTLLSESRPRSFWFPGVLGRGEAGDWSFLVTRPLPRRLHRMAAEPGLATIADEIHVGLSRLGRSAAAPRHWRPMHGELAPWTLRKGPEGELVLTDWERVRQAPPGADEAFYKAAMAAVTRANPGPIHVREALEFWRQRFLVGEAPRHLGADFVARMLRAFNLMAGIEDDL